MSEMQQGSGGHPDYIGVREGKEVTRNKPLLIEFRRKHQGKYSHYI